jgi:16S rRNA (uracil1498-N3)-methyltransferase
LSRVTRLGIGDTVEVLANQGLVTKSQVVAVGRGWVDLQILTVLPERAPALRITLATAVPKGERFDWLVEKATELGVERLIPMTTARSIVFPSEHKLDRLRRAIIEASKQCRRDRLMILEPHTEWIRLVDDPTAQARFVADPDGSPASSLRPLERGQAVTLAVGPEGGFEPAERELSRKSGWLPISLGANTLRIETAGLAGCASLLAWVGGLDRTASVPDAFGHIVH